MRQRGWSSALDPWLSSTNRSTAYNGAPRSSSRIGEQTHAVASRHETTRVPSPRVGGVFFAKRTAYRRLKTPRCTCSKACNTYVYMGGSRVENGTGKSRPDRLRLPFKPTVNRFREKNGKMGKQNGKTGGNGNGNGWGVFPTVFTVPVFSRENSRGNSRIYRSRLCYLCWKRELLFACVPT